MAQVATAGKKGGGESRNGSDASGGFHPIGKGVHNLSPVYKGSRGRKIEGKHHKRGGQDRTQEGNKVEEQQEATGEPLHTGFIQSTVLY